MHLDPTKAVEPTVLAHAVPPGIGGLGHHAAHVLRVLRQHAPDLRTYGPRAQEPLRDGAQTWPAPAVPSWRRRYTWLRYMAGRYQHAVDRRVGRWLRAELERQPFGRGYFFSQIAREALTLARSRGGVTILDSPTGHIRDFREQLCRESRRWTGWPFPGHPTDQMVRRVEDEYRLANWIRVSSTWAKESLVVRGVDERKIFVVPQAIDLERFSPRPRASATGPLRLIFVGGISLGKGFQYLLQAMSLLGGRHFSLEMVGASGDPWCRRLLRRLSVGLDLVHGPGDPVDAYRRGEVLVLPTLHDGFGLVVGEAMACGLPVITTDACGASEWLTAGESGWIAPRGDGDALAAALEQALTDRGRLGHMGRAARDAAAQLSAPTVGHRLRRYLESRWRVPHGSTAAA